MTLNDIILQSANKGLQQQLQSGAMPPGHNGPYNDPETPVRNTAHWCLIFLKAYDISDEDRFLDASIKCGSYLLSKEARPMDSVFYCRENPKKDFANGLVGQAWAIEALVELFKATSEKKYIDLAVEVFLEHPYDDYYHGWIRRNVDGSYNVSDKRLKGSSKYLNFSKFREKFEKVKVEEYPNNVVEVVENPTISILVVTYQHVDYVEKAIKSILNQETEYNYEIILGDDDSTDGTREICLDFAKKYPNKIRMFLHKRENNIKVGESPSVLFQFAYNLFSCRGEYIAILSGDDFWIDKFKLQKQVEYLTENPQFSMVCTNYSTVNEKNEVIKKDGWGKKLKMEPLII